MPQPLANPNDLARLVRPNVDEALKYVGDAITLTRHKLNGRVPLIGFSGAPVSILVLLNNITKLTYYFILVDIDGLHDSRRW